MITREEISAKAQEFDINPANVERDYVFGWLLAAIFSSTALKDVLILKGGNAFRKAYFEATRFSADIDFSTVTPVDPGVLASELNKACEIVQGKTGVIFDLGRTQVEEKRIAALKTESTGIIYAAKLYFQGFNGEPETAYISVRMDVTELDRILLPVQNRNLIHPYSDAKECSTSVRCVKLEELLANKLKCLLQRRRVFDLYDYIFTLFIRHEIAVDRSEILQTFIDKTIFRPDPEAAKELLLGLPFETYQSPWEKYIEAPKQALIAFEDGVRTFRQGIEELFGAPGYRRQQLAFFPAEFRNPIMEAASAQTLLRMTYGGVTRKVEPYSLVYKRKKDGVAQEYFYAYDQTGGQNSGPDIKTFLASGIQGIELTDEKFEPRYVIELSKAGEPGNKSHFGQGFSRPRASRPAPTRSSRRSGSGTVFILQCPYCMKTFRRTSRSSTLNAHKDSYGNRCYGRVGSIIDQRWS